MTSQDKTKQEGKRLLGFHKLIEDNLGLAKYIIDNSLTNEEIKDMKDRSEAFFQMILSDKNIQQKLMKEIYQHLKNS